jgi:hypothetical protein
MLPLATSLLSFVTNIRIHYHQLTVGRILLQTGASVSHAHPFKFFVQTSCAKEQYKVICVVFWGCWEQSLLIRTVCKLSTVRFLFYRRVKATSY